MMSKHFKQMLLLIFLMAPLKITLRAGNHCKYFNINIAGVVFHKGLPCERLAEMDVRSQNGSRPNFTERKKNTHATRKDKSVKNIFRQNVCIKI